MAMTAEQKFEWNKQCYGCQPEDFIDSVQDSATFNIIGPGMVMMSMLSDVQEMVAHGSDEEARQAINRVKLLIQKYVMDQK